MDPALDAIDRQLLALLAADARRTYAALGADVGLSTAATKRRVDKLRAAGVIVGFTVVVDQRRLGRPIEALVALHTEGVLSVERMRRSLGQIAEISEALTVTGQADTMVRLVATDTDQLEAAIQALRTIPNVRQTDTMIVLSHLIARPSVGVVP